MYVRPVGRYQATRGNGHHFVVRWGAIRVCVAMVAIMLSVRPASGGALSECVCVAMAIMLCVRPVGRYQVVRGNGHVWASVAALHQRCLCQCRVWAATVTPLSVSGSGRFVMDPAAVALAAGSAGAWPRRCSGRVVGRLVPGGLSGPFGEKIFTPLVLVSV
eukprot:1597891-Amphidinium_carterae.1